MPRKSEFKKTVFENGLTLISERMEGFRSLSMGVWIKIGTRYEPAPLAGVCHFLEHMLFKGTQRRSALELVQSIEQVGGEFNAFTAREQTCFHLMLLNRDSHLGVDILSDVILHSNFKKEEYERERNVILQEISMVQDSPEEYAFDLFYELYCGNHGLGKPILGTEKSIRGMQRKDLVNFFRTFYQPENVVIAVAGDVSHENLKKKIQPMGRKKWPNRCKSDPFKIDGISASSYSWRQPPRFQTGNWWCKKPTEQVHLIMGLPAPQYNSEERLSAVLLNNHLGGGMSSSLFQEIREKQGLAYTVYSNLSPFTDSGIFSVYAATTVEQVSLCMKLVRKCLDQVKKKVLSRADLARAKENLKGTLLLSSDCAESRMTSVARNELLLGKYYSIEEACKRVDRITAEDLRKVAVRYLSAPASLFALGPRLPRDVARVFRPIKAAAGSI